MRLFENNDSVAATSGPGKEDPRPCGFDKREGAGGLYRRFQFDCKMQFKSGDEEGQGGCAVGDVADFAPPLSNSRASTTLRRLTRRQDGEKLTSPRWSEL